MSCISCFDVHTSPGAAIRCYDAYKATHQYLHSGPSKNATSAPKKTNALQGRFLGHRSRGGRPRKRGTSSHEQRAFDRERKRRWRENKKTETVEKSQSASGEPTGADVVIRSLDPPAAAATAGS